MIKLKSLFTLVEESREIFESPMRISSLNIDQFENHDENFAYTRVIKEKITPVDKYKKYEVYQFSIKNKVFDVIVDGDFTIAYFNYDVKDDIMIEYKVWQDPLHISLCRNMLFDYYLRKFSGIMSDGIHSFLGEKYWGKLMKHAFENGFRIYVLKDENEYISLDSLDDIDKYYSHGSDGLRYKFMIKKII